MKYISWNVNGLRAVVKKGFDEVLTASDADCFCLQEIKLSEGQFDATYDGYQAYYHYADRKGYSGTAIFTRVTPLSVTRGLGNFATDEVYDNEGRVLTLEFKNHFLVNVYTPNSQDELKRLDCRMAWDQAFANYIRSLDTVKPVIICGDLNVAHHEIDLKNPDRNHKNPGFSDQERESFTNLLGNDFIDTFRYLHPDKQEFSWWSYRFSARAKNIGWRIDYFLISRRLVDHLVSASIHGDILGSDHCPVEVQLNL